MGLREALALSLFQLEREPSAGTTNPLDAPDPAVGQWEIVGRSGDAPRGQLSHPCADGAKAGGADWRRGARGRGSGSVAGKGSRARLAASVECGRAGWPGGSREILCRNGLARE